MSGHHHDQREIIADAEQYNARLVRRVDETEDLAYFWVRFDGEPTPFQPGQYMTTGVYAEGKLEQRPYSVASAPRVAGTDGYEFYVRLVPILRFTSLLWRLPIGHRMRMIGPKGKFMLEPDDERTHLFVSTGTGIAPFISMVRETMAAGQPRRTVDAPRLLIRQDELGYREQLEEWERDGTLPAPVRPHHLAPGPPAQRRLGRPHRARRGGGRVGLPRPRPAAGAARWSTSAAIPR